jgi:glycogen operon protein
MCLEELLRRARIQWHGTELNKPDWGENSHSLAVTIQGFSDHRLFHIMLNAYWKPLEFELPPAPDNLGGAWRLFVDTHRNVPESYAIQADLLTVKETTYLVHDRSVVVLAASANDH